MAENILAKLIDNILEGMGNPAQPHSDKSEIKYNHQLNDEDFF